MNTEISHQDALAVFRTYQVRHLTDRQLGLYLTMLTVADIELRPLVLEAVRRLGAVVPDGFTCTTTCAVRPVHNQSNASRTTS